MPSVPLLIQQTGEARNHLMKMVGHLSGAQATYKPAQEVWSVNENLEHLVLAEVSGVSKIWSAAQGIRTGKPVWTGDHTNRGLTIDQIIARTWKPKEAAPPIATPHIGGPLPYWLEYLKVSQTLLEKLESVLEGLDREAVLFPHFLCGPLDAGQRIDFLRFHIVRHYRPNRPVHVRSRLSTGVKSKQMATAAAPLSIEDYLDTSYRPDCDYIDDHIEERTLGELPHSKLQVVLSAYIHARRKQWRVWALTDQRVRLAPRRVRIPDVCIVPIDPSLPRVLTNPPLACFEILSDCDTLRSTAPRMRDYYDLGVRNLWILDPVSLEAWAWTPEATTLITDHLAIPGTPIHIPLPELFAELSDTD